MPVRVVLAIGFDPWWFESQRTRWQTSGNFVTSAGSTAEAIGHFHDGDFDAVLLGRSIPQKSKEQIIASIRATGSAVPVVCVAEPFSRCASCEFATTSSEPAVLMQRIGELLDRPVCVPPGVSGSDEAGAILRRRPGAASRSGLRRRALSGGGRPSEADLFPQFSGAGSPCYVIRIQEAGNAGALAANAAPDDAGASRAATVG